ncbi:tRNA (adenine22-N1)-methyltransferase [Sharpea azabuensis]|uniref:tRNA (adenine(22)-N(1))-methyltransferase n=1 Tax=Sharpea azabuensis TaxID=322505 RepID=UPI0008EBF1AE|nr:class I SAM-dependent methyltransferase [Sharpea azabuensis]SFE04283.1 tRNA (adenine22-N1)-methyltransferase [Sharpea azabuensis]SFK94690.1 tRNA (adenine22-N1)-methyltransferase [Sharpea azabuensis]
MKLHSKRLLAIAKAIAQYKQGTILADIGTDHAYLPCFLYDQGVIEKAYACDVAEGPLASSKQTIIANHMEGKIIPLLGNGLDPIVNEDVDMISICGMGGMLMIEILDAHNEMHDHRFFLQANNGLAELRAYLAGHHFCIIDEDLVEDAHHIYEYMVVEKGEMVLDEDDLLFGSINRQKKTELFRKKWQFELNVQKKIIASLPEGHPKRINVTQMIEKIEKVLA